MKKKWSLLFAFAILCACGRVIPQEEIFPQESSAEIDEQPAELEPESSKLVEELTPVQMDIYENPDTGFEIKKENPTADVQEEKKTKSIFDISDLDGLYDFAGADYSPWQMIGEHAVGTSNLSFQTDDHDAVQEFVNELKRIFSQAVVLENSAEQLEQYKMYSSDAKGKRVVRIIANDFQPILYVFPDFSAVTFPNEEYIFLDTDEQVHQAVIELVKRYNDSPCDTDRISFDRYYLTPLIGVLDFTYEGKTIEINQEQQASFLEEVIKITENRESIVPMEEQVFAYEQGNFKAVMKSVDNTWYESLYFGSDYIVVERPQTLFFFDGTDIQDELMALFESDTN